MTDQFSHFDTKGQAHMVDVGQKADTHRVAVAAGQIVMNLDTAERIRAGRAEKGDVLGIARIAAIQGAKRTADLIPLCHPLPLTHVAVSFDWREDSASRARLEIRVTAETEGKTGVEMEALMAVSVGLLTVYDMCKAVDRGMEIQNVGLQQKSGGKSGTWRRETC